MTNNLKVYLGLCDEYVRRCTANCPTEQDSKCGGDHTGCPIENMRSVFDDIYLAQDILTHEENIKLCKIRNIPDDSPSARCLYGEEYREHRHYLLDRRQKSIDTTPSYVFERIGLVV